MTTRSASILKPLVFCASLMPVVYLLWQVYLTVSGQTNVLGADPAKTVVQFNGEWALRFMLLTLAVTPLRLLLGWVELARVRRMLGLFAFGYALTHFGTYLALILEFEFSELGAEILKRPFILAGFAALCCLVPLALTSNHLMMRLMKRRWRLLHQLVYPIAMLQIVHLFWLTRSDYAEPIAYSVVFALLMAYRFIRWRQRQSGMAQA
jgi:methionine sulfoxide reductase heme-binding subunit